MAVLLPGHVSPPTLLGLTEQREAALDARWAMAPLSPVAALTEQCT